MEEKILNENEVMEEMIPIGEADLEEVAGGVTGTRRHIKIVNCRNYVNVRSSANSRSDANIIGKAYLGDRYVFYGWSGNWAKVQYGSKVAYVFKEYVQAVKKATV